MSEKEDSVDVLRRVLIRDRVQSKGEVEELYDILQRGSSRGCGGD